MAHVLSRVACWHQGFRRALLTFGGLPRQSAHEEFPARRSTFAAFLHVSLSHHSCRIRTPPRRAFRPVRPVRVLFREHARPAGLLRRQVVFLDLPNTRLLPSTSSASPHAPFCARHRVRNASPKEAIARLSSYVRSSHPLVPDRTEIEGENTEHPRMISIDRRKIAMEGADPDPDDGGMGRGRRGPRSTHGKGRQGSVEAGEKGGGMGDERARRRATCTRKAWWNVSSPIMGVNSTPRPWKGASTMRILHAFHPRPSLGLTPNRRTTR